MCRTKHFIKVNRSSLSADIDRLNEPLFYVVIVIVLPAAAAATRGPAFSQQFIVHPAV